MSLEFHPKRWQIYAAIIVCCAGLAWFLIANLDTQYLRINTEKLKVIDSIKKESDQKADSLVKVIEIKKVINAQQVESLSKRAENIKAVAKQQNKILINQYEDLFKKVECYSDDSIGALYEQKRNSANFDTLLSK
jgi:hypothetical protein